MNFGDPRLPDRFWSKCIPEPNTGCWLWIGATGPKGYGSVYVRKGRAMQTHKFAYLSLVGAVPAGLELDHRVCRLRCCVNPSHLEAVTHLVNVQRGVMFNTLKTHCPRGHVYDEKNTRMYRGERNCRACDRARPQRIDHRRAE